VSSIRPSCDTETGLHLGRKRKVGVRARERDGRCRKNPTCRTWSVAAEEADGTRHEAAALDRPQAIPGALRVTAANQRRGWVVGQFEKLPFMASCRSLFWIASGCLSCWVSAPS